MDGTRTVVFRGWASAALRRYADVASQHWGLILAIGMTFAWVHSLPLQGPLLGRLAASLGADPQPPVATFLAAEALGLVAAGGVGYYRRRALSFFPLGVIPCILITLSLEQAPLAIWPTLFALLGLSSAPVVIASASLIATSVVPSHRGHVAALVTALFNFLVYLVGLAAMMMPTALLLAGVALFLAAVPFALNRHKIATSSIPLAVLRAGAGERASLFSLWPILTFISGVTLVVGLMYGIVMPVFQTEGPFHFHYGAIPYAVVALAVGPLSDAHGRRGLAYAGALSLGVGFVLFGLLAGLPRHLAVHTLLMAGLALVNVFIWTVLADVSSARRAPLYIGLGQGANVLAFFLGVALGEGFQRLTTGYEALSAEVAGLALFMTLALMPALRETLRGAAALVPARLTASLVDRFAAAGLTRREQEIARLLVAGSSTKEIEQQLVIAPDTLKTHSRNIYRKMGVRDRRGFGLALVGELQHVLERLEADRHAKGDTPPRPSQR
ncbi:MAG: hypothetical protein HYX92_19715 [Chloroflexi bacterium]|nr:hypothetical protein [Chloroflexota bacterium]